jgi:hypothetical protein
LDDKSENSFSITHHTLPNAGNASKGNLLLVSNVEDTAGLTQEDIDWDDIEDK